METPGLYQRNSVFYTRRHCGFGTPVARGPGFRVLHPREGHSGAGLQTSPRLGQMRVSPPKHEVPTQQAGEGAGERQASGSGRDTLRPLANRSKEPEGPLGPSDLVLTADQGSRRSDCYFPLAGEGKGVSRRALCLTSQGRNYRKERGEDAASTSPQTGQVPWGVLGVASVLTLRSWVKRKPRSLAGLHRVGEQKTISLQPR